MLTTLVGRHRADHVGMQSDLRSRIADALRSGRRTFVHNVIGEGHVKNEGYRSDPRCSTSRGPPPTLTW